MEQRSPSTKIIAKDSDHTAGQRLCLDHRPDIGPQDPAGHGPVPRRERPLSQGLRRVHDRDHQGQQHRFAQLPPYQKYGYDEKEHKLIILEYPDRKN